jgi:hypothetical protein
MSANVKPLTHWAIYKGYKLRFRSREPERAAGLLTNDEGVEMAFEYLPAERIIRLPGEEVRINEYGWELEHGDTQ